MYQELTQMHSTIIFLVSFWLSGSLKANQPYLLLLCGHTSHALGFFSFVFFSSFFFSLFHFFKLRIFNNINIEKRFKINLQGSHHNLTLKLVGQFYM